MPHEVTPDDPAPGDPAPGDPALASAEALTRAYRRGRLSPVEATEAALGRIERHDDKVKAFLFVDREGALTSARASEARWRTGTPLGPLDGIPATIKDVVLAKGWTTRFGSRTTPERPSEIDAPCTARLRESGAVLLGLTSSPEFGWKAVTDSPLCGVTRNPWDLSRTPGGSSGGAAAAAVLGMGTLHIGSDGGGSIRIPSGFTGLVGHKPSFGRVPAYPLSPFGTVSHVGPMARSVTDAALMLKVISGPDARDGYALPPWRRDPRSGLDDGIVGLRIAFSPDLGYARVDPEIARAVAAAVETLADLGAEVEQVEPPFDPPIEIFKTHWYAGAARRFEQIDPARRDQVDPGFREIAEAGAQIPLLDYLEAVARREQLSSTMRQFHERHDLLVTPTLPIPAFPAGRELADPDRETRWIDWASFSYPFNLTQQPACTVPCGLTEAGLPIGLQFVGSRYDDALVLQAARAYESTRPTKLPTLPD